MRLISAFLFSALVMALGVVAFAYSGLYDVSANAPHRGPVAWLLATTSAASVGRHARGIEIPDLSGDERLVAGAGDFDAMCAGCHGAPGRERDPVGRGLNPQPPDLAREASEMTPAEVFWVTKHGIRMTGMPSWGVTHDDAALWSVVAFVSELPRIDADRYRALLARAGEEHLGHHHGGEASTEHHHDDEAGHTH